MLANWIPIKGIRFVFYFRNSGKNPRKPPVNIVKKGENLSNRDKKQYKLFKNSVKFYIIM